MKDKIKYDITIASDRGKARSGKNQDYAACVRSFKLRRNDAKVALADGMGGYRGGEIASRVVVKNILEFFKKNKFNQSAYEEYLHSALNKAHAAVKKKADGKKELAAMGSTLSAAYIFEEHAYCINVGDSRIYLIRENEIIQVSQDQSAVADLWRLGKIKAEELKTHPKRNHLTMSISAKRNVVNPFITNVELQTGDKFLFCSDGVWAMVDEDQMNKVISGYSPKMAVKILVHLANQNGGLDNISVIIVNCKG